MQVQLIVVLATSLVLSGAACGGTEAFGGSSCAQACAQIPACGTDMTNCATQCTEAQTACTDKGYASDFNALLSCLETAHYTCGEGGPSTNDCASEDQRVTTDCVALGPVTPLDGGLSE